MFQMLLLIICYLFSTVSSEGLIAYDCGAPNANITTISLLSVKKCEIEVSKPIIQDTYIRLLQLSRFREVHVKSCMVKIDRSIYNCGAYSHNSLVHNGIAEYLATITPGICQDMHLHQSYHYGGIVFVDLKANTTVFRPATLSGTSSSNGKCDGGSFTDGYGSWSNVITLAKVTIALQDYNAAVNLDENRVYLRNGRQCKFTSGTCTDNDGSTVVWEVIPHNECTFSEYDILYEGPAKMVYDNSTGNENVEEVYSVKNGDIVFALAKKGADYVCDTRILRTEHPKLFIREIVREKMDFVKKPISVYNLDIMAYVNSKFVYLEKHMGKQIKDLYIDVITQKCNLERQVIENSLHLARIQPAEFAARIMKEPGYMAKISGEVAHIIKCTPVLVKLAREDTCYAHLPVLRDNQLAFMTPETHILLKRSSKIDCTGYISPMYYVDGGWIKLTPYPVEVKDPQQLEPLTKATWKYERLARLASTGIYSDSQLDKLHDHIMFAEEELTILETLARMTMGERVATPGFSISNLLDEGSLEDIAKRASDKLWGWLTGFGTASAGVIGIFVIFKAIKFVIDTILHGYALHKVFGWSYRLFTAFWDSLSNFVLHFRQGIEKDSPDNEPISEKKEMKTSKNPAVLTDAPSATIPIPEYTLYPKVGGSTTGGYIYPGN